MKRILMILTVALNCSILFSQTLFDALKTSDNDIIGTARYSSMAGAFGALGGDPSAIKDNPAGLGIYRKSELTLTADALMQTNSSVWNEQSANDNKYSVGVNNFAFVLALPTWRSNNGYNGFLSSNFSFSYNKLKNFNRNVNIKSNAASSSMTDYFGYFTGNLSDNDLEWDNYPQYGYDSPFDNIDLPWMSVMAHYGRLISPRNDPNTGELIEWTSFLDQGERVTPSYMLQEQGSVNEYALGWSGNFSNRFYIGATLNFQSINYQSDSKYNEEFGNKGGMTLDNTVTTTGNGINLNLGAILVPVDFMRIGLALHTPMFYSLTTYNYSTLSFNSSVNGNVQSPENYVDYQLQSPLQFNVSAAFIVDKKGLISAEYVLNNYRSMKLLDKNGNSQNYAADNEDINSMLNNARTIKIGGEYKLTDNFSLRAGYANTSGITKTDATKWMIPNTARTDPEFFLNNRTDYITAGFGYREANWYLDFAYMNKVLDENYFAYNSSKMNPDYATNPADVKTTNNNIVFTLGLRF